MSDEDLGPHWWSETESPKAWMSVRDADLYEALLHRLSRRRLGATLRVIEWGAGKSTLWYTEFLERLGVEYSWVALEHNKAFFEEHCAPKLATRPNASVVTETATGLDELRALTSKPGVHVVLYDAGDVRPDRSGREADRLVDLDDYVSLPARLGLTCDLAVIDGRKRRRCTLEAAKRVAPGGYVIVHDAWRVHYQCAFDAFASGRRFGDEWWIGAHQVTDFADILPWHALERHAVAPEAMPNVLPR